MFELARSHNESVVRPMGSDRRGNLGKRRRRIRMAHVENGFSGFQPVLIVSGVTSDCEDTARMGWLTRFSVVVGRNGMLCSPI